MTRQEHLLIILAEECSEVAQRAAKALRFGMEEVQPEQEDSNAERLVQEFNDLLAIVWMLKLKGIGSTSPVYAKVAKVEKFLEYSEECGTLDADLQIIFKSMGGNTPGWCPKWAWRAAEEIINESLLTKIFAEEPLAQREVAEAIYTEFLKGN